MSPALLITKPRRRSCADSSHIADQVEWPASCGPEGERGPWSGSIEDTWYAFLGALQPGPEIWKRCVVGHESKIEDSSCLVRPLPGLATEWLFTNSDPQSQRWQLFGHLPAVAAQLESDAGMQLLHAIALMPDEVDSKPDTRAVGAAFRVAGMLPHGHLFPAANRRVSMEWGSERFRAALSITADGPTAFTYATEAGTERVEFDRFGNAEAERVRKILEDLSAD